MKVLHLLEATLGGTRRHVVDLLLGLKDNYSNEVQLYFGYSLERSDSNFSEELKSLQNSGITCFECSMYRSITIRSDLKALYQIIKFIKKHNIDIIHAHSAKAGYLGRIASKLVSRSVSVYTPNSSPFRLSKFYYLLEIIAGHLFTDAIIAVAKSEKEELVKHRICNDKKVYLIESGIPCGKYEKQNEQYINGRPITIGTVGRMSNQKAPFRFIEIAKSVIEKNANVKFIWVGDGELRNEVENRIRTYNLSEKIEITGWLNDVERKMVDFDIFILPSEYESFGYVTVEAMRAGLPCVVSNITGSRDIVINGKTGFIVDKDNIHEYRDRLLELAEYKNIREKMGEAGKERWNHTFHSKIMVKKTFELYKNIC